MELIILFFIIYIIALISVLSFLSLAPWLPTANKDLKKINEVMDLKEGEEFLELGCGTARVSLYLAKQNPNTKITGIELSPLFFLISKIKVKFAGLKNIEIKYGNALEMDLTRFDAIYIFGLPKSNKKKILPKLKNIKNKNFRFVSYWFEMENNIFSEVKHIGKDKKILIYEYKL